MAIGSQGEIGTDFDQGPLHDWLNGGSLLWRLTAGDDLLGGYGKLDHPDNHPDIRETVESEALQMYPLQPYCEDTYQQIRADVLASWHTRGIVLNEKDGGDN
jgi:hypothetical protein